MFPLFSSLFFYKSALLCPGNASLTVLVTLFVPLYYWSVSSLKLIISSKVDQFHPNPILRKRYLQNNIRIMRIIMITTVERGKGGKRN